MPLPLPSPTTTIKLFLSSSRFATTAQQPCILHNHQRPSVSKISYVRLTSHPTWHSRTSSWTLSMDVPKSILYAKILSHSSDLVRNVKSHFRTKVVVCEDYISLEGKGAPNVVGLFKGKPDSTYPMNRYDSSSSLVQAASCGGEVLLDYWKLKDLLNDERPSQEVNQEDESDDDSFDVNETKVPSDDVDGMTEDMNAIVLFE
ncbi:hypothetical protein CQW23_28362 [Capsicum baccatum]|uniref:Uncharacterized protein n=1 Tax=Capsicum baccatum TaxID=33114 RepID=A0A2G2VGA6_CAPBA|nr:hypothetical protein CQW23_28362 [Capsicum baccatum]